MKSSWTVLITLFFILLSNLQNKEEKRFIIEFFFLLAKHRKAFKCILEVSDYKILG